MNLKNNKILITGGASGIGKGLAERFLKDGNTIIVCGRRNEVLEELKQKHPSIITKVCDLSVESKRIELLEWVKENHPDLNVLVNNAGIQNWMSIEEDDFFIRAKNELAVNVEAPIHLTALFIKLRSLSTIINVTSGLSFCPLTKVSVYSATKAFFHSFTLSMQEVLKIKNIEVIELIPPAINTDLGGKGIHEDAPPVHELIDAVFNQLADGKKTLTFGMSDKLSNSSADELKLIFERMNK